MKNANERELGMLVRLDQYTAEYLTLERQKEQYFKDHSSTPTREVILTLHLQQEYIDTVIRRICMLVRRCHFNEIDFDNEVATMVYDKYDSNYRKGFLDLI